MKLPALAPLITVVFGLLAATANAAESRTWTQASNGKTVEAEFVKLEDGKITIRFASGKTRAIDMKMFSEADQEYAKNEALVMEAEAKGETGASNAYEEAILWDVHMCCNACIDKIKKTAAKVKGTVTGVDKTAGTITVRSNSKALIQKVFDSLATAGFYGEATSNFTDLQIAAPKGGTTVTANATFKGVHICCEGCVDTIKESIGEVAGVQDFNVTKGKTTFDVKGNFKPADVVEALRAEGLNATF